MLNRPNVDYSSKKHYVATFTNHHPTNGDDRDRLHPRVLNLFARTDIWTMGRDPRLDAHGFIIDPGINYLSQSEIIFDSRRLNHL